MLASGFPRLRTLGATLVRVGIAGLLLGSGPLFLVDGLSRLGLLRDPNPNPVGFGILFYFTFKPSVACLAAGLVLRLIATVRRY